MSGIPHASVPFHVPNQELRVYDVFPSHLPTRAPPHKSHSLGGGLFRGATTATRCPPPRVLAGGSHFHSYVVVRGAKVQRHGNWEPCQRGVGRGGDPAAGLRGRSAGPGVPHPAPPLPPKCGLVWHPLMGKSQIEGGKDTPFSLPLQGDLAPLNGSRPSQRVGLVDLFPLNQASDGVRLAGQTTVTQHALWRGSVSPHRRFERLIGQDGSA